jgi:2-succinyl-6-hydroxy-2,4-cyclohexadiene-1-carboxylate synthase
MMPSLPVESQGSGETLLWLHGFTQTRRSARNYLSIVAGSHAIVTPDLPGHGESSGIFADLDTTAHMLREISPPEPFFLGGYSMGGRVALHVALQKPSAVRALVVLSGTRGIATPNDRRNRIADDEQRAQRIESIGTELFLDEWLAGPLFRSVPDDPEERRTRSGHATGLAESLRRCGTGTQRFLGDELATLTMPVLLIAGADDEKFAGEALEMGLRLPDAHVALIPHAGHAAHLEQPEVVGRIVVDFLANY